MFEESGQEVLVASQGGQRIGCLLIQMVYVSGGEVGLASVLDVAPRAFDRIQLWAIGRQVFKAKPGRMLDREVLGRLEMGPKVVPNEHHPTTETIVQSIQEWDQKRRIDVAVVQLERKLHPSSNGRDRNRPDRREPIMPGRFDENWRMARRRPTPTDRRLKHEAGFIQEHYRLAPTGRPFFIRGHSTLRQRSSASGSCCRARRCGFCGVRSSWRRIFNT